MPFEACNLQTVQVLWCLADLKNYEIRSGQSQAPKLLIITWLFTQLQENLQKNPLKPIWPHCSVCVCVYMWSVDLMLI